MKNNRVCRPLVDFTGEEQPRNNQWEQPKEQPKPAALHCEIAPDEQPEAQQRNDIEQRQSPSPCHNPDEGHMKDTGQGHKINHPAQGMAPDEGHMNGIDEGQAPSMPICPLPAVNHCAMVRTVTAKSVTRIGVRLNLKAYNRRERFFCAQYQHTCPTMAGLLGASSDAPVSFKAGYANPDNLATISEIGVSYGGSKLEGARTMAITCRMALLKGSAPTASQKAVTVYRTHTYLSRQQARQEAQKLNAVVCAWTPAERVHA